MTALEKKENKFIWTDKCKESFQKLEHLLMTALVFRIADPNGDFVVCMNASKEGLGGVLLQNNHTNCYKSQKLKEHEENFPTHVLELETIIHALRMWRNYLMGSKFLMKTKKMSLKYLFDQPDMNARQARWLDFLNEYHFEPKHIKGNESKDDNTLS